MSLLERVDLDALLGAEAPAAADYVIDRYLPRGQHMLLCGRGGLAKTMLVNQLCVTAAASHPEELPFNLEIPVDAEHIVWFDAEMGKDGTRRRYWDTGLRQYIGSGRIEYIDAAGLDLTNGDHYENVRAAVDGADLVVFDSLRRVCRYSKENSSDEMSAVVQDLTDMAHELGPAILTIHHQGGDPHKWFRGSTAIFDAADVLVGWLPHTFDGDDDKLRRLAARGTWAKVRHGAEPEDRWFVQQDNGLLVPLDEAPLQTVTSKYDEEIRALLPFTGTKTALAEACNTNSRNGSWADAYNRVATKVGDTHIDRATVTEEVPL